MMKKTLIALFALAGMAVASDSLTLGNAVGCFLVENGSITSVVGDVKLNGNDLTLGDGTMKWGADVMTDRTRTEVTLAMTFDMSKLSALEETTRILSLGGWGIAVTPGSSEGSIKFCGSWSTNPTYYSSVDITQTTGERDIVITASSGGTRLFDNGIESYYTRDGLKGDFNNTTLVISDLGLQALTKVVVWSEHAQTDATLAKAATAFETLPEPATATLSLLALAGLCARRKRY